MDFFETVSARQSVRAYENREIEAEKLNQIMATIVKAPSGGNLQAFRVFVVRDVRRKQELATAALDQQFMAQAPVVFVFCADKERSGRRYRQRGEDLYSLQDATIATAYAQLAATALGLATCWIGAFDENKVGQILKVPSGQHPIAMLPIGYAAEQPASTPRRPMDEIVVEHHH